MEFEKFIQNGMYHTYCNGLDLDENSIIFDLGTYLGQSAEHFSNMYNSKIYTFEPFEPFYIQAKSNLATHKNIQVFPFGLGNKDSVIHMSDAGDATSSVSKVSSVSNKECQIKDFFVFLEENNITKIDLLYVNIEGGEYDLLDYIYSRNFQINIKYIIVQYHYPSIVNDIKIQNHHTILSNSHVCVFNYKYIWTKWVNFTQIPYEEQYASPLAPVPTTSQHMGLSSAQTASEPHMIRSGRYSLSDSLRRVSRNSYRTQS